MTSLYMFWCPRRYDVYVIRGAKRLHVHSANANTLGAVEPGEFFVSGRVGRRKNERRQYTEVAADGTFVAVRTQVKDAIIQAVDPRTRPRLQTLRHIDYSNTVLADAQPIDPAGPDDPLEARPHEASFRDVQVDPQSIRHNADYLRTDGYRAGPEERGIPVPARLACR